MTTGLPVSVVEKLTGRPVVIVLLNKFHPSPGYRRETAGYCQNMAASGGWIPPMGEAPVEFNMQVLRSSRELGRFYHTKHYCWS